eukprot:896791-Prymnesium_polylepis.1
MLLKLTSCIERKAKGHMSATYRCKLSDSVPPHSRMTYPAHHRCIMLSGMVCWRAHRDERSR